MCLCASLIRQCLEKLLQCRAMGVPACCSNHLPFAICQPGAAACLLYKCCDLAYLQFDSVQLKPQIPICWQPLTSDWSRNECHKFIESCWLYTRTHLPPALAVPLDSWTHYGLVWFRFSFQLFICVVIKVIERNIRSMQFSVFSAKPA